MKLIFMFTLALCTAREDGRKRNRSCTRTTCWPSENQENRNTKPWKEQTCCLQKISGDIKKCCCDLRLEPYKICFIIPKKSAMSNTGSRGNSRQVGVRNGRESKTKRKPTVHQKCRNNKPCKEQTCWMWKEICNSRKEFIPNAAAHKVTCPTNRKIRFCCEIGSVEIPETALNSTSHPGAPLAHLECDTPDEDVEGSSTELDTDEDGRDSNENKDGNKDTSTVLIAILVTLLLCIAFSAVIIILCKHKRQVGQLEERGAGGLPEQVESKPKIITIYTTANNPEVLSKPKPDHCYEEIRNAPPEDGTRALYVTIGPSPSDQQSPSGNTQQQEDRAYSELASTGRDTTMA